MKLPIFIVGEELDFQKACHFKQDYLETDWKGSKTKWNVAFSFLADPKRIHYIVRMPVGQHSALKCFPKSVSHDFVEGLWERDLAEFFLKSDTSDAYQEFNLAPNGNWWSALFSGYRKREDLDCRMKGVETFSLNEEAAVLFGISVPRLELKVDIGFTSQSRMNVTAIVNSPTQEFLIWSAPPLEEADFHRLDYAPKVEPK